MIDSFGNMPSHPLLVHIPVVLVPLATLAAIACALRPSWRARFGSAVAALAGIGFVGALLAASSGESLEDSYEEAGQTISATLHDHAEMGERARLAAFVFFVVMVAWIAVVRWWKSVGDERATSRLRRPRQVVAALAVLAVLTGVGATATVIGAGHGGAESVWERSGG